MKSGLLNMTEGSLSGKMIVFSFPLVLSNLLQVLFNLADVAVVGKFAGAAALGAVGSTTILLTLFTGFLIGMGSGVNVRVALFLGAKDSSHLRKAVHTAFLICFALGVLMLAFGIVFSPWLLRLLHTKEDLLPGAVLYLRIFFLSMPAMAMFNYGNGVLSAAGNTRLPLVSLCIGGVINVILNLFFVIACRLGVAGVAIASVISQVISCLIVVGFLFRTGEVFALRMSQLRLDRAQAAALLPIGFFAGLQNVVFAVANLFIQSGVNSFDTVTVEGISAAANADSLVYTGMNAFYTACSTFISQNLGASRPKRIRQAYWLGIGYSFAFSVICSVLLLAFGKPFLYLFTNESEVVAAGMMRLKVMCFSYWLSAFMDCSVAASRGLGDTFWPMIFLVLGSCIYRIAYIYTVFAHFHTVQSLYLVYITSWTLTSIAEVAYFLHKYKKTAEHLAEKG